MIVNGEVRNDVDGYQLTGSGDTVSVTSSGSLIGTSGAGVSDDGSSGHGVENYGYIAGGRAGVSLSGANAIIDNRFGAVMTGASYGLYSSGDNLNLENIGFITGQIGVRVDNVGGVTGSQIFNDGSINGWIGVAVSDPNALIANTGLLSGSHYAIRADSVYAANHLEIDNAGLISGAIDSTGEAGSTQIHNGGVISGDITLGNGPNLIDNPYFNFATNLPVLGIVQGNITGGAGNDMFDLSSQAVTGTIAGGGGEDVVSFATATAGVTINLTSDTASGGGHPYQLAAIADATGSGYADTITGDGNANVINAGAGNDTIVGAAGNDTISAGPGIDTVMAGPGADTVYGNGGNDTLYGNGGADRMIGGSGADVLTGGSGNDTFVYNIVSDSTPAAPDLITDFVHGEDKIDLTALHTNVNDTFAIMSSGGFTYVGFDGRGDGTIDTLIKLTGTNVVAASDILWTAPLPSAHTASVAVAAVSHHAVDAAAHAAAIDHGLYG